MPEPPTTVNAPVVLFVEGVDPLIVMLVVVNVVPLNTKLELNTVVLDALW